MPDNPKDKYTTFPSLPPLPEIRGVYGPSYGVDFKAVGKSAIRTSGIINPSRFAKAVVGTSSGAGIDFTDIQKAINAVSDLGGGVVLLRAGVHKPSTGFITLKSNVYLIGEDAEKTIIDNTSMTLSSGQASLFAGGEQVSTVGTIALTGDSATVTGTSTQFSAHGVKEDDVLYINFHPYHVKAVASDTSLTLKEPYRGANTSGLNYSIYRPTRNIFLENFTLLSDRRGNGGGILIAWCEEVTLHRVKVRNFSGDGIIMRGAFNFTLDACESYGNTADGFVVEQITASDLINNGIIINCLGWANNGDGLEITGNSIARVSNCSFNANGEAGIFITSDEIVVQGCTTEFNADGIFVQAADYCQIIGNNVSSNTGTAIAIGDADSNSLYNVVSGNNLDLNSASNNASGILVEGGFNSVTGNTIRTGSSANDANGIFVGDGGTNNTITGNTIDLENNTGRHIGISCDSGKSCITGNNIKLGSSNDSTAEGILLDADADNCVINGNFVDGQSVANTYGISIITGAAGNNITGNKFLNCAVSISEPNANSTNKIKYNDQETIVGTNTISDATVTATSEGTAETIASLAVTVPILSRYHIRLWVRHENSNAGQRGFVKIQDGTTDLDEGVSGNTEQMSQELVTSTGAVGDSQFIGYLSTELTAGAHTLNVKSWVTANTQTINKLYLEVESERS